MNLDNLFTEETKLRADKDASYVPAAIDSATKICAVIVSYFPSDAIRQTVAAVLPQVQHVLIVDNNSGKSGHTLLSTFKCEKLTVIENIENLGIATALNLGVIWARDNGYNWVLTLDQDTICEPQMVATMWSIYQADADREKIAVLAPVHYDQDTHYLSAELRHLRSSAVERNYVMSSGNLIPMRMFAELGPYDDDFFIEYVDHDFCLRARKKGYRVILVRDARMAHRLGDMKSHSVAGLFSFFSHNYHPVRRYYRARNRLVLYRRYFGKWIFQDQRFAFKDLMKIILVEKDRWEKFKAALRGSFDGLLGRLGRVDGATHSSPKAPRYFVEFREEILPLLPEYSAKALDLGCGSGETSGTLRKLKRFGWVCGVEGNPAVATIAKQSLDQVLVGDIEKMEYPFAKESVDTILTLDILEHLVDPWVVLEQLKGLLKPGGHLVVSIPNIRHYSVVLPLLLSGDFRYQQEGILDSTHLRFFTLRTVLHMLRAAGFEVVQLDRTGGKRGIGGLANRLTLGLFQEFLTFQNLIACRKPDPDGTASAFRKEIR